jgi:hypothetical protein
VMEQDSYDTESKGRLDTNSETRLTQETNISEKSGIAEPSSECERDPTP